MSTHSEPVLDAVRRAGTVPAHIAMIMDGNGRWAQARGLPRTAGHQAGMASVRECVEGCLAAGVGVLTLFAFSQENWQRPREEIDALMLLLEEYIGKEAEELARQGVQVRFLGDLSRLGPGSLAAVERLTARTAHGTNLILNLCLSYGARAELTHAARAIAEEVAAGRLTPDQVDEAAVAARLYTAGLPDPDLLIRTSGEMRLSNFLLWQVAYAELYVTPVLWPDFTRAHLYEAILDFQGRSRRFGKVGVA